MKSNRLAKLVGRRKTKREAHTLNQESAENIIIKWLSQSYTEEWNKFTTGFHRYNARDLIKLLEEAGVVVVSEDQNEIESNFVEQTISGVEVVKFNPELIKKNLPKKN